MGLGEMGLGEMGGHPRDSKMATRIIIKSTRSHLIITKVPDQISFINLMVANYRCHPQNVFVHPTPFTRKIDAAMLAVHTCGSFSKMPDVCINSHPNIRKSVSVSEFKPSSIDGVAESFSSGMRILSNVIITRLKSRTKVFTSAIL